MTSCLSKQSSIFLREEMICFCWVFTCSECFGVVFFCLVISASITLLQKRLNTKNTNENNNNFLKTLSPLKERKDFIRYDLFKDGHKMDAFIDKIIN